MGVALQVETDQMRVSRMNPLAPVRFRVAARQVLFSWLLFGVLGALLIISKQNGLAESEPGRRPGYGGWFTQSKDNFSISPGTGMKLAVNVSRNHPAATRPPYLAVLVCSHPLRQDYRQAVRHTWGAWAGGHRRFRIYFLVGRHADDYWNQLLGKEDAVHGDILRVDVLDTYANLSLKVLRGLQWAARRLENVAYVMKTDDDVYVNVDYLLYLLKENETALDKKILGALSPRAAVSRDLRDPWGVSLTEHQLSHYPPYVSGGGYVMALPVVRLLCTRAEDKPRLHLEDVYITGVLARAAGVSHVGHAGFSFWTTRRARAENIVRNERVNSVNMAPGQIYQLHWRVSALLARSSRVGPGRYQLNL